MSTPDKALCTEDLRESIRREVGKQLGESDHWPVFLKLTLGACTEATFPWWNYKRASWTLFKHQTSTLSKDIIVQGKDINMVAKNFNFCILKAAQETIPRGARRNYRLYWSQELQDLQDALSEARAAAEVKSSQKNNTKLQQAKAKFLRHKIAAEAGEKKQPPWTLGKMAESFGNLQSSAVTKVTPEQRSPWKKTASYWLGNKLLMSLLKTMQMRARFPSVLQSREKQGERSGKEQQTE